MQDSYLSAKSATWAVDALQMAEHANKRRRRCVLVARAFVECTKFMYTHLVGFHRCTRALAAVDSWLAGISNQGSLRTHSRAVFDILTKPQMLRPDIPRAHAVCALWRMTEIVMSPTDVMYTKLNQAMLEATSVLDCVRLPVDNKNMSAVHVVREIFGNPFSPPAPVRADKHSLVLARACADGDWVLTPILADALEDSGCVDANLLAHLRGLNHLDGCWAVDHVLGRK